MLRNSIVSVGKCTDCADVLFGCSHPTPFYILVAQWIAIASGQASDAHWKVYCIEHPDVHMPSQDCCKRVDGH